MTGGDNFHGLFEKIKLKDVMKSPVVTIYEDDELSIAEERFTVHGVSYLPVVSHGNKLVGLLTQKYVYKTQSPRRIISHEEIDFNPNVILDGEAYYSKETLDSYILRNIMKHDPFSLGPDDNLADAISNMNRLVIGCIPIVDEQKKVIGVLTIREIIVFLASKIK